MLDPADCNNGDSNSGDLLGVNHLDLAASALHSDDEELPHVLRDQDRFLPIANVAKLMKKAIPERGKIARDAKECVQESVSEFISFITSEAAERCAQEKRKTINGEDILYAMSTLGFDNYVEPLKIFLQKYREVHKCDANGNSTANTTSTTNSQITSAQLQQPQVLILHNATNNFTDHDLEAALGEDFKL